MGAVSDYLRALIAKQVDDNGLVVLFDPEAQYAGFVRTLDVPYTEVACYEGSFFALRRQVEPWMGSYDAPPRLVVYVPLAEEDTEDALIELVKAGVVMKPGQSSIQRNTRLSVVAKGAFRDSYTQSDLESVARQVEAGKLTLEDLDRMVGDGLSPKGGVISTIFGTGNAQAVALEFLASDRYDAGITRRRATEELAQLLGGAFGIALRPEDTCPHLRNTLARHALLTEFVSSIYGPVPSQLSALKTAPNGASQQACIELVRSWRLRRDLRESYADHAGRVEKELGPASMAFTIEQVGDCETFAEVETRLQSAFEARLVSEDRWPDEERDELLALIDRRLGGFWATWPERYLEIQARWQIIQTALNLLTTANIVEAELKTLIGGAAGIMRRYSGDPADAAPWCMLDTYQRHLERRSQLFDFDPASRHLTTEKLVNRARQRYIEVGGRMAESFVQALARTRFIMPGYKRQLDIYSRYVAPAQQEGKTAYILVDALRFEMARELGESLRGEYDVSLSAVAGTLPTITEIGMAALMPGVQPGATVVPLGSGKLGLQVEGVTLKDRNSRLDWFRSKQNGAVAIAKLEEVLPKPKKALEDELRRADIILVTSQEIDALAEGDNIRLARKVMDDVLLDLAKLANKLRDYGCKKIIITADHGYLFGEEMDTDMKINPPGGNTMSLHRRVWVGKGGSANAAYLRAKLVDFGLSDDPDMEIAAPWGFGVFMVPGGARAYFHGGMSPQEMTIPVLVLEPKGQAAPSLAQIVLTMTPGSKKISTRFFSVQIAGQAGSFLPAEPPRVRVEIRANNAIISAPISASYGFSDATGDVQLQLKEGDVSAVEPDTVTLMIKQETTAGRVSVHLLDAVTGMELAVLPDIEMTISI